MPKIFAFYDDFTLEIQEIDEDSNNQLIPSFHYKLSIDQLYSFTYDDMTYLSIYEKKNKEYQLSKFHYYCN